MYSYQYEPAGIQHGYIHLYQDGTLLGTNEVYVSLVDMGGEPHLLHMAEQANAQEPGRMIPSGDPRWYTHCQWCGEPANRREFAYDSGQWHYPECYRHRPHR